PQRRGSCDVEAFKVIGTEHPAAANNEPGFTLQGASRYGEHKGRRYGECDEGATGNPFSAGAQATDIAACRHLHLVACGTHPALLFLCATKRDAVSRSTQRVRTKCGVTSLSLSRQRKAPSCGNKMPSCGNKMMLSQ